MPIVDIAADMTAEDGSVVEAGCVPQNDEYCCRLSDCARERRANLDGSLVTFIQPAALADVRLPTKHVAQRMTASNRRNEALVPRRRSRRPSRAEQREAPC